MTYVVLVVAVVAMAAAYVTWLAARIDRLYARVDAAFAALDAELVRRAAAAQEFASYAGTRGLLDHDTAARLRATAHAALEAGPSGREGAENDVSRELRRALDGERVLPEVGAGLLTDLEAAATKVGYARQFHNDAVRDTRALRFRRLPRLLRLSRGRPFPAYFEIDDTALPPRRTPVGGSG